VARVEVEQGTGVLVRSACAPALRSALATALAPGVAGSAAAAFESQTVFRVDPGGEATLDLGEGDCARYLVLSTIPGAPDPSRARILVREATPERPTGNVVVARVVPAGAEPPATTPAVARNGDGPQPGTPTPTPVAVRARVKIRSVRVMERQPDGDPWDVANGPVPDVFVVAYRGSVLAARTPVMADRYNAAFDVLLDQPVDRSGTARLRFDVVDEDAAFDDPIGSASLEARELPARAGEVTLPLHLTEDARRPSGWLTLWVEPAP
jgi:hypothetical protein